MNALLKFWRALTPDVDARDLQTDLARHLATNTAALERLFEEKRRLRARTPSVHIHKHYHSKVIQ